MHIVFYAAKSGLGNNGGTNTIVRSAVALRELGHEVDIVAAVDRFTWLPHNAVLSEIPAGAEAVVAVSYMDVKAMHKALGNSAVKRAWWMRLWDSERLNEGEIAALARMQHTIVNASWMQTKLRGMAIESTLVYQGVDLNFWDVNLPKPRYQEIGTLIRKEPRKGFDVFLDMMSRRDMPNFSFAAVREMRRELLRDWYTGLTFYFAPTTLEGLHNPPMEAAMCGAMIVCRGIESNGMGDYATPETAIIYDDINDVPRLLEQADPNKIAKMRDVIVRKIGDREKNMQRFVEVLG